MVPGLGNGKGKFLVSVGWREANASRSYFNSRLNHDFTALWLPHERLSVLDVTGQYQINSRFSVMTTLPIVFNRFSMLYPPEGKGKGLRYNSTPRGIGDVSVYTQGWLLDAKKHPFHNLALGVGIKAPTGNWNYRDLLPDESGTNFRRRAVYPPAIMPGDGGTGILVGFQGWRLLRNDLPIIHGGTVYASGNYLINPRNTNGTPSIVSNLGVPLNGFFANRLVNSVADSYNARVGIALKVPGTWQNKNLKGLRFRIEGNAEGLNSRDLFGHDDGFRQPGYTMSIGPGVTWNRGKDTFIADVPIVFNRHINPGATVLPGNGVRRNGVLVPAPINFNRQMGLVAPMALSIRYVRSF